MDPTSWRRHRALAALAHAWPELQAAAPPSCATLDGWLARAGSRWRVAVPTRPARGAPQSYESAVTTGTIPTREGSWHDVFNVLAFIAFPHAKHALHHRAWALQRARRGTDRRGGVRSREEDALALIDEGSLVLAGSPHAIAALDHARRDGGLEDVDAVVQAHGIAVRVLGHALLEHLVLGRRPIGAGIVTVALAEPPTADAMDRALAQRIAAGGFPAPCVSPTVPWPDPRVDAWLA